MANTKASKIMVPQGQYNQIMAWVAEGRYASFAAFCNEAISFFIDRQKDLETRYNEGRAALPEMKSGERV